LGVAKPEAGGVRFFSLNWFMDISLLLLVVCGDIEGRFAYFRDLFLRYFMVCSG